MLNITIRQMQAVLTIHATGRVASAARAIGLTGPAVTLQLKQVEDEIGAPVFDRTAQGMRATATGEVLIEAAREVLERLGQLETDLAAVLDARYGRLNVGIVSTAQYLAPALSNAFAIESPDIELSLMLGSRQETINRLKAHEVDVILTSRPPGGMSVRAVPFAQYNLIVVASPTHKLANRGPISHQELAHEQFIVREEGTGPRQALAALFPPGRGARPRHLVEMMSNADVAAAVIAGLGIAFVANHTVSTALRSGALIMLHVTNLPMHRQWFAVSRSDRTLSPAMAKFQDFLLRRGTNVLRSDDAIYGQD